MHILRAASSTVPVETFYTFAEREMPSVTNRCFNWFLQIGIEIAQLLGSALDSFKSRTKC